MVTSIVNLCNCPASTGSTQIRRASCRLAQEALEVQRAAAAAALERAVAAEQREEDLRTGGAAAPTAAVLKAELDAAVRAVGEQRARAEAAVRRAQLAEDELAFLNAIQGANSNSNGGGSSGVHHRDRPQSAAVRSRSGDLHAYDNEHMPMIAERSASAPETEIAQLVAEVCALDCPGQCFFFTLAVAA